MLQLRANKRKDLWLNIFLKQNDESFLKEGFFPKKLLVPLVSLQLLKFTLFMNSKKFHST